MNKCADCKADMYGVHIKFCKVHRAAPMFHQALSLISEIGANPITQQGCKTRKDFIRLADRMWQIAFRALADMSLTSKKRWVKGRP